MKPDPSKTVPIAPGHCIEIGGSTWDETETSIRSRYNDPRTGNISRSGSSELAIEDLRHIIVAAATNDLVSVVDCVAMVEALASSLRRKIK